MRQNYYYNDFEEFNRTFMVPAVNTPNNLNNIFVSPTEGFLRGNMFAKEYIPYKNMNYIKPNIVDERQRDLYKIQEMSFAAHDINLYLDTHPNDNNAISLYNKYMANSKMLMDEYERKYGMLNLYDESKLNNWNWIDNPWPWSKRG